MLAALNRLHSIDSLILRSIPDRQPKGRAGRKLWTTKIHLFGWWIFWWPLCLPFLRRFNYSFMPLCALVSPFIGHWAGVHGGRKQSGAGYEAMCSAAAHSIASIVRFLVDGASPGIGHQANEEIKWIPTLNVKTIKLDRFHLIHSRAVMHGTTSASAYTCSLASNSWLVAVNEIMLHCGERKPAPPTNYPVTVILLRSPSVDKH